MSVIASTSPGPTLLPSRFGELKSEDFVKLIFTELRNQDPFKPNDSSELLRQIDSIRSIQTNMELGQRLSKVADSASSWGASDMIGRYIKGYSTELLPVSGSVIGVIQSANGPLLELESGHLVPMGLVQSIHASKPSPNSSGDASGSGGSDGNDGTDGKDGNS